MTPYGGLVESETVPCASILVCVNFSVLASSTWFLGSFQGPGPFQFRFLMNSSYVTPKYPSYIHTPRADLGGIVNAGVSACIVNYYGDGGVLTALRNVFRKGAKPSSKADYPHIMMFNLASPMRPRCDSVKPSDPDGPGAPFSSSRIPL